MIMKLQGLTEGGVTSMHTGGTTQQVGEMACLPAAGDNAGPGPYTPWWDAISQGLGGELALQTEGLRNRSRDLSI